MARTYEQGLAKLYYYLQRYLARYGSRLSSQLTPSQAIDADAIYNAYQADWANRAVFRQNP